MARLDRAVPDYITLCPRHKTLAAQILYRRAEGPVNLLADSTVIKFLGNGGSQARKHGVQGRCKLLKVHLAMDIATSDIRAKESRKLQFILTVAHISRIFLSHPLTRQQPALAFLRFVRWQLAQRIFPAGYVVPLVGNTRLIAERGMVSATGNIYCGLMEYEDMAFVIHFLRPNDLFCDIGANIGIYSIIAAGVAEANVIAVEPVSSTAIALEENINLNRLNSRIRVERVVVGEQEGTSVLRTDRGTGNHVVDTFIFGKTEILPMRTLETVIADETPIVIKIDVEGFEWPILKSSKPLLSDPICQVLIIETNGSGARYNISDSEIESYLKDLGFSPYSYDPRTRILTKLDQQNIHNTIYIKDIIMATERVKSGKKFEVLGEIF